MNLTEATYVVRYLSKFRIPAGVASQFPEENPSAVDYLVFMRRDDVQEPVDLSDLGQALWLLGFRMMMSPTGVITFEKGPKLLDRPMADFDDVEVEEVFEPERPVFGSAEEAIDYLNRKAAER